jgi:hypothetical protein
MLKGSAMSRGQLVAFPTAAESPPRASNAANAICLRRRNPQGDLGRDGWDPDAAAGEHGRPRHPDGGRRGASASTLTLALVLVVVLGVALFGRQGGVAELPAAARARVYAQTLTSLQTACIPPRTWSPTDYCREQIQTVLEFPECGADCRALVQQAGHRPMK